jgi:virginiamycin B lyase
MRGVRRLIGISALVLAATPSVASQGTATPAAPPAAAVMPLAAVTADATVPVRMGRGAVATDDAVWLPDAAAAVVRVEAKTNAVGTPVPVGGAPCASLAVAFGSLWVPRCAPAPRLVRVDTAKGAVSATLEIGPSEAAGRIATGVGSVWLASDARGVVSRIDPDTNGVVGEVFLAGQPAGLLLEGDTLWVTSVAGGVLTRVDAHSAEVGDSVTVGAAPGVLVAGEGSVWVLNRGDGTVSRVAAATGKVEATIRVADGPADGELAAGAGAVWVSLPGMPIVRIDPRTNRVVQRFTGDGGGAILVAHGSVWVNAGAVTRRFDPKLLAAMRPD